MTSSRLLGSRTPFTATLIGLVVFAFCLLGIATRPVGLLASVWPANAVLLGVMVRHPEFRGLSHWLAATAGYIAADMLTGGNLGVTLWLTSSNIVGVAAGLAVYSRLPERHRELRAPNSALVLIAAALVASFAAAIVGCWMSPVLLGRDVWFGLMFWTATEAANYLLVLPAALAAPRIGEMATYFGGDVHRARRRQDVLPAVALALSVVLGNFVGGPGALAIPVPALLWCALHYRLFLATILNMIVCGWQMVISVEALLASHDDPLAGSMSLRLGLAVLSVSSITVAIVNAERSRLIMALRDAVNRDFLTNAVSRAAFFDVLGNFFQSGRKGALIMADIDNFKAINDTNGHAGGDLALVRFVEVVTRELRSGDIVARLGGEEFALLLPDVTRSEAAAVAGRLRAAVAQAQIGESSPFSMTVSLGVSMIGGEESLAKVLSQADEALYEAKSAGRNLVCFYGDAAMGAAAAISR